jgi:hypothetical protein
MWFNIKFTQRINVLMFPFFQLEKSDMVVFFIVETSRNIQSHSSSTDRKHRRYGLVKDFVNMFKENFLSYKPQGPCPEF